MSWNYRIVRRMVPANNTGGLEPFYAIHEAYYDERGRVWAITKDPAFPSGDSEKEFRSDLTMYHSDGIRRPVLNYEDVPEPGAIVPGGTAATEDPR